MALTRPLIRPLGDHALTVAFSDTLSLDANRRAVATARAIEDAAIAGVKEVAPTLVSVFIGYDPDRIDPFRLSGEIALVLEAMDEGEAERPEIPIPTRYGGEEGPDLPAVAALLGLSPADFVALHAQAELRVLATGFAPGFVYCGVHTPDLLVPRREDVRQVPKGTVLFAAGQTALCATPVPTGWHVIGRTDFDNFDPSATPPMQLAAGDRVRFAEVPA